MKLAKKNPPKSEAERKRRANAVRVQAIQTGDENEAQRKAKSKP